MNNAYLLTGGNMGDRQLNLELAKKEIDAQCGKVTKASWLYETTAWGNTNQPSFLNQALEVKTSMNAKQLIRRILKIEKMMGRTRNEKYGPRIIDIDILLFAAEIYDDEFLRVPHPELQNRRFALLPLAQIAAEIIHPVFNKTIAKLLRECTDKLEVKMYS